MPTEMTIEEVLKDAEAVWLMRDQTKDEKVIMAYAALWRLIAKCRAANASDNPENDGTDFAHPAFWRGRDDGARGAIAVIAKVLDGNDDGVGVMNEPMEGVRRRVMALVTRAERAEAGQLVRLSWS